MAGPTEPNGHDPWSVAGDVGQAGLRAAGAVVEQLLALSRRLGDVPLPISTFEPSDGAPGPGHELRRLRADAERLIELYGDWTRALLDGFTELAEGRTSSTDALVAGPAAPGAQASTTAWLHVLDGTTAPASLFSTDLVAHDGGSVGGAAVDFEPVEIGGDAAGSPMEVRVCITIPAGAAPGTYHGTVLAAGLPEVHLPLRLEVAP